MILYILYSIIRIIYNLSCTKETVFLMPQTKTIFENVKRYHVRTDLHNRGVSANHG